MIKWFSPTKHYDPADYEAWFEKLAAQGYHPQISAISFIAMRFYKETPKKYKYVIDLQAFPKQEYFDTYKNFGWEYVGKMASMFIWRKEYFQEKPAAFSDRESIYKRNARVSQAILFSTVMAFIASILCWIGFGFTLSENDISARVAMGVLGCLTFIAGSVLLFISLQISRSKKDFIKNNLS